MKRYPISCDPSRQPLYPNAADTNYFARKALEILTALITGAGALSAMLFFITLS